MWSETFCSWTLPVPLSASAPLLWPAMENSDFSPWKASDCAPVTTWRGSLQLGRLEERLMSHCWPCMLLKIWLYWGWPDVLGDQVPGGLLRGYSTALEACQGTGNRGSWGSWVQWLVCAPGRQICSLIVKHGLQLSNKRHTGELLGKLWVCGEWYWQLTWAAGRDNLGQTPENPNSGFKSSWSCCVTWDKSLTLSDPSFSYLWWRFYALHWVPVAQACMRKQKWKCPVDNTGSVFLSKI